MVWNARIKYPSAAWPWVRWVGLLPFDPSSRMEGFKVEKLVKIRCELPMRQPVSLMPRLPCRQLSPRKPCKYVDASVLH